MSQDALNDAVRTRVRDWLRDNRGISQWTDCDLTYKGQPPAACGEQFIGIAERPATNRARDSWEEFFGVIVVVTRRLPFAPWDRWIEEVVDKTRSGLRKIARELALLLHSDYTTMNAANVIILAEHGGVEGDTDDVYGFCEPLFHEGTSDCELRGPSWFHGAGQGNDAGMSITVQMGGAKRLQSNALKR